MSTLLQNIANFNPYQINSSRIGIWGSHSVQKLHCGQEQSFGELASSLHFQPHFLTTTEIAFFSPLEQGISTIAYLKS
jgi:hypothetical protein